MRIVEETSSVDGVYATYVPLAIATPSYYRWLRPKHMVQPARPPPPRALTGDECRVLLDVLHEERFVDLTLAAPHAAHPERFTSRAPIR